MNSEQRLLARLARPQQADHAAAAACQARWDELAKPLGSLGRLETAVIRLAAMQGTADVDISRRATLVFCADNGLVTAAASRSVTQSGPEVTAAVAREMAAGHGNINALGRTFACPARPYDVGMLATVPGVRTYKSAFATADISRGPALSREQAADLMCYVIAEVEGLKKAGLQLLIGGEMGIGNTSTTAAVSACLLGLGADRVTGRGAGLSTAGLSRKERLVAQALAVNRPDPSDPLDVLSKVGGFDIVALTGLFVAGAVVGMPVVIDGVIACCAAALAAGLLPESRDFMLASHVSREPAARLLLQRLGLEPLIDADLALGEGSGGVLLLPLLDGALAVYDQGSTFSRFGLTAYEKLK